MNRLLHDNALRYRLSRHLLFFCLIVLFFTLLFFIQDKADKTFLKILWITFTNALFFFSYAYLTIFILIPEFLVRKRFLFFIVLFLIVGIGLSAIKLITSGHIFYSDIAPENIENTGFINLRFILVNTKDMSFIVALFCITKYAKDYLFAQNQMRQLNRKYLEAQNKLLQLQFDPHFLFNTMNNLYSLSLTDTEKAREVIRRFKIVLAYLMDETKQQFASLEEELNLVKNYIALHSLRYGERLGIEFDGPENPEKYRIPSMVLFFLVENSFRHGTSTDAGNPWIKLHIGANTDRILISVKNSKPPSSAFSKNGKKGSFFRNLSKRLTILLGEKGYSLAIKDQPGYFEVDLELKKLVNEDE